MEFIHQGQRNSDNGPAGRTRRPGTGFEVAGCAACRPGREVSRQCRYRGGLRLPELQYGLPGVRLSPGSGTTGAQPCAALRDDQGLRLGSAQREFLLRLRCRVSGHHSAGRAGVRRRAVARQRYARRGRCPPPAGGEWLDGRHAAGTDLWQHRWRAAQAVLRAVSSLVDADWLSQGKSRAQAVRDLR